MTYPNYPQPGPQFPPQQQPQYPPAQPQYPPPAYPPQQQPYYPAPGPFTAPEMRYPQPPAPAQPRGTIDDFYDQPAASGKSIASWFQTPGQSITGTVARDLTDADTRPQTDMQTKQPRYFSDGRPMLTMTIPLLVQPSQDFPDGRAAWIIASSDKEDLDMAMQAAGCEPRSVPRRGDIITVTFTGLKQIPGFGVPKKVKQVTFQRPGGNGQAPPTPPATAAAPGAAPATWAAPATASNQQYQGVPYPNGQAAQDMVTGNQNYAPAPQPYAQPQPAYQPDPYAMATGQPQYAPQAQFQPPAPPTAGAAPAAPGSTPGAPPTAAASPSNGQYAVPDSLTPEQAERLRQLTGQ